MTELRDLGTVRLETERLILRQFTLDDAQGVFDGWTGDAACAATWRVHPDVGCTEKILEHWIDEYEDNAYNWLVERKDTHEIMGNICAMSVDRKNRGCQLGYCYGTRFWGNGYATEALRRVIDFLLDECRFHLIEARHVASNPASGRVMQKVGMCLDAVLPDRVYNTDTGSFEAMLVYSIKR